MKITEGMRLELQQAARREDGRLSPSAYERHRNALKRRGLIDDQSIITPLGKEVAEAICACKSTPNFRPDQWADQGRCIGCGMVLHSWQNAQDQP
jgi:hypothetical protein